MLFDFARSLKKGLLRDPEKALLSHTKAQRLPCGQPCYLFQMALRP